MTEDHAASRQQPTQAVNREHCQGEGAECYVHGGACAPLNDAPPLLAVDGKGYVWRVWPGEAEDGTDIWSMAPANPDNSPVPEPVTYYERVHEEWHA